MSDSDNNTNPENRPLAPWGSYERGGHPYPITPDEHAASAAYRKHMEAPAKERARALIAARDAYIPSKEHDKGR